MLMLRLALEHLVSWRLGRAATAHAGAESGLLKLIEVAVLCISTYGAWSWFTGFFHVFGPIPRLPWGG